MEKPKAAPRNLFNNNNDEEKAEQAAEPDVQPSTRSRSRRTRGLRDRDRPDTFENDSDLDAAEFNRQIEKLERELARRERELQEEQSENERALDKIKKLERDKLELKREVEDFREEANDYKRNFEDLKTRFKRAGIPYAAGEFEGNEDDMSSNQEYPTSVKNYELILLQKNREINQLIEDIEKLEDDKRTLQDKLSELKDSLQEATTQIETMANDHFNLKSKLEKSEERIKQLEEENTVLGIKQKDLLAFKERHDQYLENLCSAVDVRVDVWKKMMFEKDEEIDRLNVKIATIIAQQSNNQADNEKTIIQQLKMKLLEREQQITVLNEKLKQATEEIDSSVQLIESLHAKINTNEEGGQTAKQVKTLQLKLKKCEVQLEKRSKQLSVVEKEAEEKSREIALLMSRLHTYEAGEYGLQEAVSEIKDLKTQIRIRNAQVETLTQDINILQLQVNDLMDENDMLRAKLGKDQTIDLQGETKRYCKNRKNEVSALRAKVAQLENEIVQFKTSNRTLKKQVAQLEQLPAEREMGLVPAQRPMSDSLTEYHGEGSGRGLAANIYFNEEEWKEKYDVLLEENTELRKGMQDILEAMHRLSEDSSSDVFIESPILENLLREMSARGLIHYPYSITSFHLKVCNVEGRNSQLREELHRVRQEEKQYRVELTEAKLQIQALEEKLTVNESKLADTLLTQKSRPRSRSHSPSSRGKKVTFDAATEPQETAVESDVGTTSATDISIEDDISKPATEFGTKNLILEDLVTETNSLRNQNKFLKSKLLEEKLLFEDQMKVVIQKANTLLDAAEDGCDSDAKTIRKIEFLKSIRDANATEITFLIRRNTELENENIDRIGSLERFKTKALHQISVFQQILEGSVPIHLLYATKKQLRELTQLYHELKGREERIAMTQLDFYKKQTELSTMKENEEKQREEIESLQAKVLVLSVAVEEAGNSENPTSIAMDKNKLNLLEIQKEEMKTRLEHQNKMNALLKSQIDELEKSKKDVEMKANSLMEKLTSAQGVERELREKTVESVSREEYDAITKKLISIEEKLLLERDEMIKWKEIAEMAQNQIKAVENIKDFERMEFDSLLIQVAELQTESNEKAFVAKAQRQVLVAEKEKHLAIQQVQKLLSKLSHLEACSLQQEKVNRDREMALISMHTQVIMRYRTLFAALHESHSVRPPLTRSTVDFSEAFELFTKAQEKCVELENQLFEEKVKLDECDQRCKTLEDTLRALKDGNEQDFTLNSMQKIQDARIEIARWKRKAEQSDSQCVNLRESVQRLENRASNLEEDRIRLEHSLELKDSLTSTLIASAAETVGNVPLDGLSSKTGISQPSGGSKMDKDTQVGHEDLNALQDADRVSSDKETQLEMMESLRSRISELEYTLQTKEKVINEFKLVQLPDPISVSRSHNGADDSQDGPMHPEDVQEALEIAKENIHSLQDRLKTKEESINQYRKILAEVRTEMSSTTERHVQEMRALQLTIYQQQQAFTRMKSTLSQPVKDTLNIEGTIKDQLTRIHELEDEVSELQHALGNVASQLTTARSEAHRWRCTSDARLKELDSARENISTENLEEINSLRQKLHSQQKTIEELQSQCISNKNDQSPSLTQLVVLLRAELDEKEKQLDIYMKTLQNSRSSARLAENRQIEERLLSKEKEMEEQREQNKQLQQKVAALQVRISKLKIVNTKSGVSSELDQLRQKFREVEEEKLKLEKQLNEFISKRDEEEEKRRKTTDSVARWEESKKWKRNTEKLESRIKELESENEKLGKTIKNLRTSVTRLEKEKMVLDSRIKTKAINSSKTNSVIKGSLDNLNFTDSSATPSHVQSAFTDRLNIEIQDLKEQIEKIEFEATEESEKYKMEIKCLKDRIVTQERQLTAYQIAQKGDTSIRNEIEKMAVQENNLQKEVLRLEEENLHLKLQMEQLRMDTPRLRDRVQHLQKLVDALKSEKPEPGGSANIRSNSQKSLSELERTIAALKQVIDKLQSENKRLKTKPNNNFRPNTSNERLKSTLDSLLSEKRTLLDEVQVLQEEKGRYHRLYLEATSRVEEIELRLTDAEKRAKSSEMKLKGLLGECGSVRFDTATDNNSGHANIMQRLRSMQEELDRKNSLLGEAQVALKHAEATMGKRQNPNK